MNERELINLAKSAAKNSYCPYSHFKVGAALLCSDGSVFLGCNVENASFGATNCAERTAFFSAVSSGKRDFKMIAIAGTSDGISFDFTPPCGICRQVLGEFCDKNFKILLTDGNEIKTLRMEEIFPFPFDSF